jgi:hypothetical protein
VSGISVFALGGYFGLIFVAPLFSLLAIFVHELGHAIAAWSTGWKVIRIVVAGIAYEPRRRKWTMPKRPATAGDIGGWVEASEPLRGATRASETIYILGGPVANFLVGILCLVVILAPLPQLVDALFRSFGVFSIAGGLANLIPSRIAGAPSDGLLLWRIWRPHRRRKAPKPSRSGWRRTPDY